MKENKPDVVLTYTIKPNIYGGLIARIRKVPYIANITGLGTAIESKSIISRILASLYRFSLNSASHIYYQNKENVHLLNKSRIKNYNYSVLPGSGVNTKEFKFKDLSKNETIQLFYIGRIMKSKGIDEFLRAANILKKKYKNIDFNVIGSFEEDYKNIIKDLEQKRIINYLGFQVNIQPFLEVASAIILPSYHEGMSNVLLEGAATGRPLIASNMPGCKEIIDDGINGFLFEPKNVKSLVESIEKFLKLSLKEKERMGVASRKKVEREFDRDLVVKEYLNKINEIVGGN